MTDTTAPDGAAPDTAPKAAGPQAAAPGAGAPDAALPTRVAIRTCPLCEATCGLELTLQGDKVTRIRGDRQDVFSHGYLCPKGSTVKQLHEDPDRLRQPLVKRNGRHVEVSWAEAFAEVDRLLVPIIERHGRDAVAVYLGNPTAHNLSPQIFNRVLLQGLGHPEPLQRVHGRPDAQAGGRRLHVRHRSQRARARPRPHRLPAHLGCQPVRLERQPLHGA